jgi:hypothetical protein
MIFSAIGYNVGFKLVRITCRDNSVVYINTLKEGLLPFFNKKKMRFMKDNVAIDNSAEINNFILNKSIFVIDWLTHSTDLNQMALHKIQADGQDIPNQRCLYFICY